METSHSKLRPLTGILLAAAAAGLVATPARADYTNVVIADNPIAFYPLDLTIDNSGTATDLTGNNDSLYYNLYPATGPSAYIPNSATFVPSSDSYVDLSTGANPSLLQFTGPITLEAWVQNADSTSFGDIIAKGYDSSTYQEIVLRVNGPYGSDYYGSAGTAGVSGGQQNTNWAHVVLANDGTYTTLYVDGVVIQRANDTTGAINFSDNWAIGNGTSAGYGRFFNGNLCQVAMYDYGLSAAQVLNHFYEGEIGASSTNSQPIIISQPQPAATYVGGPASFSVGAVSAASTTNQWYFNGNPIAGQTGSTLTLANVQPSNAGNYSVVVGNGSGTTNSATALLSLFTPAQLEWSASGNSGIWDTSSSANWLNLGNSQVTVFNPGDQVIFDDKAGEPLSVAINGSVSPSLVTVDASTNSFTITGPGTLTGTGGFIKKGTSYLLVNSPGNFTGPAVVAGGVLYAGNNSFDSTLSITVSNAGTFDIGGATIGGSKPVYLSGYGFNGQGAFINSYADYPGASIAITMTADASLGGSARWDLANGSSISGPHNLLIDWSADTSNPYGEWNSPVIGSDVLSITLTNGSKIGAKNCDASFQNPNTMMNVSPNGELDFYSGGWNGGLHLYGGATAYLWTAPSAFTGTSIILEQGSKWYSYYNSGDEPINSAVTLNGVSHWLVGDHNMIYTNVISGSGGFLLDQYNHEAEFYASNTYSGPTIIGSSGNSPAVGLVGDGSISHSSLIFFGGNNAVTMRIDATSRNDGTWTLASGQTLQGIGAVNGSLIVSPGAAVSPAGTNHTLGITTGSSSVGTLSVSGDATLGGALTLKLDGGGSNDVLDIGGTLTLGGTLTVTPVGTNAFSAGESFTVFNAGGLTGSFTATNLVSPGAGLAWDLSQLDSGVIGVITGTTQPTIAAKISGGNLLLTGANGTAGATFYVVTSSDLTVPVSQWTPVSTNTFSGTGTVNVSIPVSTTGSHFYVIKQ